MLDTDARRAVVRPFTATGTPSPKKEIDAFIEQSARDPARWQACALSFGAVSVAEQVAAFQRKRVTDHEVLDLVALDVPEQPVRDPGAVVRAAGAGPSRRLPARHTSRSSPRRRARPRWRPSR